MWWPDYINEMKNIGRANKMLGPFDSIPMSLFISYWEEKYKLNFPENVKIRMEKNYFMEKGFISVIDAMALWNELEDKYKNGGLL